MIKYQEICNLHHKMKNKAYHNVGQFPKFNQIIVEAKAKSITPKDKHMTFTFLAWYMQSTKDGGVTLVLWVHWM